MSSSSVPLSLTPGRTLILERQAGHAVVSSCGKRRPFKRPWNPVPGRQTGHQFTRCRHGMLVNTFLRHTGALHTPGYDQAIQRDVNASCIGFDARQRNISTSRPFITRLKTPTNVEADARRVPRRDHSRPFVGVRVVGNGHAVLSSWGTRCPERRPLVQPHHSATARLPPIGRPTSCAGREQLTKLVGLRALHCSLPPPPHPQVLLLHSRSARACLLGCSTTGVLLPMSAWSRASKHMLIIHSALQPSFFPCPMPCWTHPRSLSVAGWETQHRWGMSVTSSLHQKSWGWVASETRPSLAHTQALAVLTSLTVATLVCPETAAFHRKSCAGWCHKPRPFNIVVPLIAPKR